MWIFKSYFCDKEYIKRGKVSRGDVLFVWNLTLNNSGMHEGLRYFPGKEVLQASDGLSTITAAIDPMEKESSESGEHPANPPLRCHLSTRDLPLNVPKSMCRTIEQTPIEWNFALAVRYVIPQLTRRIPSGSKISCFCNVTLVSSAAD